MWKRKRESMEIQSLYVRFLRWTRDIPRISIWKVNLKERESH